jgi:uncharacterized protein GlcG (DUF336 family)
MRKQILGGFVSAALLAVTPLAWSACSSVTYDALSTAAKTAAQANTGGYGLPMWVTLVDETGKVCWVTTTGTPGAAAGNSEWLGSRVISAQKANTANAFSLNGYAISTANLYAPVQPNGGSLYGLQASNPVNAGAAYLGNPGTYGKRNDPLRNKRIGGVNVFGGGLALYSGGQKVGAIGVSGDTPCRDHAFAWRVRAALGMQPQGIIGITTWNFAPDAKSNTKADIVPPLPGAAVGDEMIISTKGFNQASSYWTAWSQPACPNSLDPGIANTANGVLVVK